jgi:tetratricopeptide (TPR) repeat protein
VALTGSQARALHRALVDAYRTAADLEMLTWYELDVRLADIDAGGGLGAAVFSLIRRLDSEGRWKELAVKARRMKPHNALLAAFVQQECPDSLESEPASGLGVTGAPVEGSRAIENTLNLSNAALDLRRPPPAPIRDESPVPDEIEPVIVSLRESTAFEGSSKQLTLQELRTEEQLRKHFVLIPGLADDLRASITAEKDVLLLGLPFCGKTTLLTYWSHEASRASSETMQPIYLKVMEGFTTAEVPRAVPRLRDVLRDKGLLRGKKVPVLVLDNIHRRERFELARELLLMPQRPWRVWAAARSAEFTALEQEDPPGPWRSASVVRRECSRLSNDAVELLLQHVFLPLLTSYNQSNQFDALSAAFRDVGAISIRCMARVWKSIDDGETRVEPDWKAIVGQAKWEDEDIIRSLWPQTRAGLDGLALTSLLVGPSQALLTKTLAAIEDYGDHVARATVDHLRSSLALVDDGDVEGRLAMPDDLRKEIGKPENRSARLEPEMWRVIEKILKDEGSSVTVSDVSDWKEIALAAGRTGPTDVALAAVERAVWQVPDNQGRSELLWNLAASFRNQPDPAWQESIACYTLCLPIRTEAEHGKERARVHYELAFSLHEQRPPEWQEAAGHYREADRLFKTHGGSMERALCQYHIGYCLSRQSPPDFAGAASAFRDALSLINELPGDEHAERLRVPTLTQLAASLHQQPAPRPEDWQEAIECARSALALLPADSRTVTLLQLAYLLRSQPTPDWIGAAKVYEEVLAGPNTDHDTKVDTLRQLAHIWARRPDPDWHESAGCFERALALVDASTDPVRRSVVLQEWAYCAYYDAQVDWDAGVAALREAAALAQKAGDLRLHVGALFRLGQMLACHPRPHLQEAIDAWRQALTAADGATAGDTDPVTPRVHLTLALDRAGLFEEADALAVEVERTYQLDGITKPDEVALWHRRHVLFALRRNNLAFVLAESEKLRGGPEHDRATLVSAIAHAASGHLDRVPAYLREVPSRPELAMTRVIAEAYFQRYPSPHAKAFFQLLEGAPQTA